MRMRGEATVWRGGGQPTLAVSSLLVSALIEFAVIFGRHYTTEWLLLKLSPSPGQISPHLIPLLSLSK